MFYKAAYYACMATGIALAAIILSDRFSAFFLNPAVQIMCVCGGMAGLYWLTHAERGRMD